jgi:acetyl-CoA carboxylase biotin carboxylase subunit
VPSPGKVTAWHLPGGPGIRIDTHVFAGYTVPPYYDSLIAKLVAHGHTREQAIARMSIALSEFAVEGIKTNIRLHRDIMADEKVRQGGVSIHYLEEKLKTLHS